jgi:hypothetical protein
MVADAGPQNRPVAPNNVASGCPEYVHRSANSSPLCGSVVKSLEPQLDAEGCDGLGAPRDHQKTRLERTRQSPGLD